MRKLVSALLAAGVLLGACARPSIEAYVEALERMAVVVEAHRNDCDAMGRALARFLEREGEPIRTYQAHSSRLTHAERAELEGPRYGPRVQAAMARLVPGHRRCDRNSAVRKAYERL